MKYPDKFVFKRELIWRGLQTTPTQVWCPMVPVAPSLIKFRAYPIQAHPLLTVIVK
jgi:hypothetical protein